MSSAAVFKVGPWTVSPGLNLLDDGRQSIKVEPRAMDVLVRLAESPGAVVSVEDLFSSVWRGVVVSDNSVYVAIKQLRQALDVHGKPSCIETIPKRGYRLTAPVDRATCATAAPSPVVSAAPRPSSGWTGGRRGIAWRVGLALAMGATFALLAAQLWRPHGPPARSQHWLVAADDYVPGGLAISPDGEHIAYVAATDGVRQLWLRPIDYSREPRVLPGTQGASRPFWSPDSRSLAFTTADYALLKIDIAGGPPVTLADDPQYASAPGSWGRDGTILLTTKAAGTFPIGILATARSDVTAATEVDFAGGETGHFVPQLLPDGEHFLYIAGGHDLPAADVYVGSRTAPSTRARLFSIANTVKYGRMWSLAFVDGFLLYVNDTTLFARRFDAGSVTLRGEPIALRDNVDEFSVSATGVLVYTEHQAQSRARSPALRRLAWFSRSGERLGAVGTPPADFIAPRLSPDGRRIAVGAPSRGRFSDVSIITAQSGVTAPLTFAEAEDVAPIWSPAGSHVVFSSARSGTPFMPNALYRRPADGSGADELLLAGAAGEIVLPFDWSADGEHIVFGRSSQAGRDADIWVLPVATPQAARALLATSFREYAASLSPDGRWIAYVTNETGRDEVVVRPFPDVLHSRRQISVGGGTSPRWRRDGGELYYLDPAGILLAVDIDVSGAVIDHGMPQPLFATGLVAAERPSFETNRYDVTADGQRFLLGERASEGSDVVENGAPSVAAALPIRAIVNWTADLERK